MDSISTMELAETSDSVFKFYEIYKLMLDIKKTKKALRSFGKYVPIPIVRMLTREGKEAAPGVKEYNIVIYFSDIANFTNITEKLTPTQLVEWISMYFDEMSEVIMRNNGLIDKFIGDSVMAFWGAPVLLDRPEYWAVRAAYECNIRLVEFNVKMSLRGLPLVKIRTGIDSGMSLVGNLGSNSRLNYTCIGNHVNCASRLEGVNKMYKTDILISESVYNYVLNDFLCRPIDLITVQGQEKPVYIYEVQSPIEEATEEQKKQNYEYYRAFHHFMGRNFDLALKRFRVYQSTFPEDHSVGYMIERCNEYIENPPPEDWNFVTHTSK
jgi:adenylate cyclase